MVQNHFKLGEKTYHGNVSTQTTHVFHYRSHLNTMASNAQYFQAEKILYCWAIVNWINHYFHPIHILY